MVNIDLEHKSGECFRYADGPENCTEFVGAMPRREKLHKNERLYVVDIMQGIAMLLVVIGHHWFKFMPDGYRALHGYIYSFHMPLFIFISGFLISYAYKGQRYSSYIYKRVRKFFIPYFIIGVMVVIIDGLLSKKGEMGIGVWNNICNLAIAPRRSPAMFLWYIYVLFGFYVIYPLLAYLKTKSKIRTEMGLMAVGIILFYLPVHTDWFALQDSSNLFLFYVLGVITSWNLDVLRKYKQQGNIASFIALATFIVLSVNYNANNELIKTGLCFLSMPAIYVLAVAMEGMRPIRGLFIGISKQCFHIYLLHMFFIQGMAIILMNLLGVETINNLSAVIYVLCSTILSMAGSVCVFKIYDYVREKIFSRILTGYKGQ